MQKDGRVQVLERRQAARAVRHSSDLSVKPLASSTLLNPALQYGMERPALLDPWEPCVERHAPCLLDDHAEHFDWCHRRHQPDSEGLSGVREVAHAVDLRSMAVRPVDAVVGL